MTPRFETDTSDAVSSTGAKPTLPTFASPHIRRRLRSAVLAGVGALALQLAGCHTNRPPQPYQPFEEGRRDPAKATALNSQAYDLLDSDPTRAEALLREALGQDLYCGPAHNNLGLIYLNQGKLYEAAGEFEWAKRLLPGHPDPRMNLALTLERGGRTDDAIGEYRTALDVYPGHVGSVQALTRLQIRAARTDERTIDQLKDIAMRGDSSSWRDWAKFQLAKRADSGS